MSERRVSSRSSKLVAGAIALSVLTVEAKFFFNIADYTESYLQDSREAVARPALLDDCVFVVSVQQPLEHIQDALERETGIADISPSGLLDSVGRPLTVEDRPGLVEGYDAGALAGDSYYFDADPAECKRAKKSMRPVDIPSTDWSDPWVGAQDPVDLLPPRPMGTDIES